MDKNIMIIKTDEKLVEGLKFSLEQDQYSVDFAFTLEEAVEKLKEKEYNLVILDLILPDGDGLDLCEIIRENSEVPIIVLTKKKEDVNKILALEYGADDYVTEPFNILELKARIKALFRRAKMETSKIEKESLLVEDFTINALGRKLTIKDQEINLTGKEFDLFYILISNPGRVFTREELLENIWGFEYFGDLRTVDVHIRRLREKIEKDSSNLEYIKTKWGVGYYFNIDKEDNEEDEN